MTTQPPKGNGYVRRGGLLVPASTVLTPEAVELRDTLAGQRHVTAIAREDEQARRAGRAHHRNRLAEIAEKAAAARRTRRARKRDTREQADLNRLYVVAVRSGTRARIRADIQRSAEMRALRVGRVRGVTLVAGLPILSAFAAWSTAGAQAGAVKLLNLKVESPGWWAAWGIEPALISIVALVIVGRAVLRASGGDIDWRAAWIEWAALGTSLGLNIFGGWVGGLGGVKTVMPHAIGPTFCALTALLIGLFVGYASDAKPWDDAPSLTDMGFVAPADAPTPDMSVSLPGDDLAAIAQLPADEMSGDLPDMATGHESDTEADTEADMETGQGPDMEADTVTDTRPDSDPDTAPDVPGGTPAGHAADMAGDTLTTLVPGASRTLRRPARRTPDRTPKWSKEQLKAFRLRDTRPDITYPQIAREVGVSDKTVSRWFKAREAADSRDTDDSEHHPTTLPALPIAEPNPYATAAVNGHDPTTQETN